MNAASRHLPVAVAWMAPELLGALPQESLADCSNCPMAGAPFLVDVRCCTFHPVVPNFLAGRALRRGGVGAAKVRERLQRSDGLDLRGIGPPAGWKAMYDREQEQGFGRRADWACPFWVKGPLSCSIWEDRNHTCRSWHCKHVDKAAGQRLWAAQRALGRAVESALAVAAAKRRDTDPIDAHGWELHYLACAADVESWDVDALEALQTPAIQGLRDAVTTARIGLSAPMPDVLLPHVNSIDAHVPGEVTLVGYSDWEPGVFPADVLKLLGGFDGTRTWREAVAFIEQQGVSVDPSWVQALFDLDLLRAAE
jgi:hypothetical protein